MKLQLAISAFSLSWLVQVSPALAESNAPPTDCDRYAARELTRDQMAPGVAFEQIEPRMALPACLNAVERYPGSSRLIFQLGRTELRAGQFEAAAGRLRMLSEKDYAPAQQELGAMYSRGEGVKQSNDLAFSWARRSAEGGDAYGQYSLGSMYQSGQQIQQDLELAELWYSKSADQGYDKAKQSLAALRQGGLSASKRDNPSGPTVIARGLSVVPGAIICSDYATVAAIFQLYTTHWEETVQDKLTHGDSRLLRGAAMPLPDLQAYGCTLLTPGTPMTLARKTPVPVVIVTTSDGETIKGVTMPGMIKGL